jgi:hypothetical protein
MKSARGTDNPEMLVPSDTKLSLQLLSPISTATNKKGDKFSCKVLTPAEYAGAIAEGHIRDLKHSGKADKESKIDLAFEKITLPDGRSSDFSATVSKYSMLLPPAIRDALTTREQSIANQRL